MITPFGKNLLVQLIEPEKKKGLLMMVSDDVDPIARCRMLGSGGMLQPECKKIGLFRRHELRDCIDKDKKLYIISEECLLAMVDDETV